MKSKKAWLVNLLYPICAVLIVLLVWQVAATRVGVEMVLPSPITSVKRFGEILRDSAFYRALWSTFLRGLNCFLLSALSAALLSVLSALWDPLYRLINPIVSVLRSIPTMSVILLFFIWLNAKETPTAVAALVTFPLLYTGFTSAISGVDKNLLEMAKVYKVPLSRRIFGIVLPSAAEPFFDQMKSGVGLNYKVLIAAEVMVSTRNSLGNLMMLSKVELDTASLFAYTLAAVALSLFAEGVVLLVKYLSLRWNRAGS